MRILAFSMVPVMSLGDKNNLGNDYLCFQRKATFLSGTERQTLNNEINHF